MSRFLSFIFVVVLLVVGVLFAAPNFIPVETYKPQIAALVKEQTGRDLTIDGDISLSFLPRLSVTVNDVTFANAEWAPTPNMATMDQLEVVLKVAPLLRGEIALDRFILLRPQIDLAFNRQGKANWVFDVPSAPAAAPEAATTNDDASPSPFTPQVTDIQLGEISLINGRVRYSDARSGASYEATDINLDVSLPSLNDPLGMDGSLTWNGDIIKLSLDVADPRAFSEGNQSGVSLDLTAPKLVSTFNGSASVSPALAVNGTTSLKIPSVRDLAAWTGQPLSPGGGLGPLDLGGDIAVSGDTYSFTNATLSFDGMNGTGNLTVDAGRSRPLLSGTLSLDRLNANTYLTADGATGDTTDGNGGSGAGSGAAASGWSNEPIDLSGLKAIDADLKLSVGEILFQDLTIGQSALGILLTSGKMTANLTELDLYEGAGTGSLVLDGSRNTPAVTAKFDLQGISAYPLLRDAAGFERIEGAGTVEIDVRTAGNSQKAMMSALGGSGSINFADGAIRGVNIAELMRNVFSAATTGWASGGTKSTDFSELSGTFTIANGILSNSDLKMLSPLVRVTGKGTVSMPDQTLNYRVEPKLAATLEGQGGTQDSKGIEVPVLITGPWSNPSFTPDLASIIANPEGIKDVIDSVKEDGGRGLLQGILGSGNTPASDGATSDGAAAGTEAPAEKPSPRDAIRGLFNR
jgi:AsmA protein